MSQVKLTADSGGGSVALKAPATTTSNAAVQLTLPVDDGTANQYLKTDGSGALSWATSSVTALNNATENELVTVGSTTTELDAEANLTFDGEQLNVTHAGTSTPENQIVLQASAVSDGGGSGIFLKSSAATTTNRYGSRIHTVRESGGASQLIFSTEITGGGTGLQEALKISPNKNVTVSDGDLVIGTSGHGIDFSATSGTGTSELFDDYEEGEFTMKIGGSANRDTYYMSGNAEYTKIGRMVHVHGYFAGDTLNASADGQVNIFNLPFTPSFRSYGGSANVTIHSSKITFDSSKAQGWLIGTSGFAGYQASSGGNHSDWDCDDWKTATCFVWVGATYIVDA